MGRPPGAQLRSTSCFCLTPRGRPQQVFRRAGLWWGCSSLAFQAGWRAEGIKTREAGRRAKGPPGGNEGPVGLCRVRPPQRAQPSCPPASVPPGPQLCLPLLFSSQSFFFFFKLSPSLFSWPRGATCGILIPQPGIEPPPLGRQCLDYWTTRENLSTRSFLHLLQSVWSETKGVELVSNKTYEK